MSDDLVKQSIAELQDLVRCRCHPAYKDRKLHDPDCECDNAENVKVVADWIERLEANIDLKADFIDGTMNQLAASDQRIEELEAKLAKAVEALEECVEEIDAYIQHQYPHDHPVQERHRQEDYASNPARLALAELKGQDDA